MRYFMLLLGALFLTSCAPRVYQAAAIETIAEKHTTIAVIQPKVDYKFERPNRKNWSLVPSKETIAEGIQAALADWIVERQEQGILDITVVDVETTNKLLADADVTDYSELARALGVDAVMVSRLKYDTRIDYMPSSLYWADELPQSRIYLNLFTPEEGLIWSYERGGHHFSSSYNRIVFDLLGNAAARMPYAVAK